jgi:hypothetical protein
MSSCSIINETRFFGGFSAVASTAFFYFFTAIGWLLWLWFSERYFSGIDRSAVTTENRSRFLV